MTALKVYLTTLVVLYSLYFTAVLVVPVIYRARRKRLDQEDDANSSGADNNGPNP